MVTFCRRAYGDPKEYEARRGRDLPGGDDVVSDGDEEEEDEGENRWASHSNAWLQNSMSVRLLYFKWCQHSIWVLRALFAVLGDDLRC